METMSSTKSKKSVRAGNSRTGKNVEVRRLSAQQRTEVAKTRTPEEQLARLDAAFGVSLGAKKERLKLAARIKARTTKTAAKK